jgi:alpha-tubulin suppressor-like RCC1 family protein
MKSHWYVGAAMLLSLCDGCWSPLSWVWSGHEHGGHHVVPDAGPFDGGAGCVPSTEMLPVVCGSGADEAGAGGNSGAAGDSGVGGMSGMGDVSPVASELAAGVNHTCALLSDRSVKCWGNNFYGELGDGSTTDRATPTGVTGLGGLELQQIAAGRGHTCAVISDGSVRCWGDNANGQLGDGSTTDRTTPVSVSGLSGLSVHSVAAGGAHTCAVISDGSVRCWGDNANGQLGDGTTIDRTSPVQVSLGGLNVHSITAGGAHACAIISDGSARCWGNNMYGQLGDGSTTDRLIPTEVAGLNGLSVLEISAGYYYTCARMSDGYVRCWGDNMYGPLGNGTDTGILTLPTTVLGLSGLNVLEITAEGFHTCARISDGSLRCWGNNMYGQLGRGAGSTVATFVPATVVGLEGLSVQHVCAGGGHTCAAIEDGSVRCWGDNQYGQLGAGTSTGTSMIPVTVVW